VIRNQWYAILSSKEIPRKGIVSFKRMGERLAFWRDDNNEIACIFDRCCHRGASISSGKVVDGHAQCPFHGFEYSADGKVTCIPALGRKKEVDSRFKVNSYVAVERYGLIWIFWGDRKTNLPELPFFDELKTKFHYSQIQDHWPVHYTRCIENQMDVVHLPFVHHTTIGRGGKTIVYGPKIKWEGDTLTWYVKNVKDDGTNEAKSASEMGDEENLYYLQTIMPNIWQNVISEKVRIFAAFAPIDDENTMIYLRFYQAFMPVWGIRHVIGFAGRISSKIILNQDKRVVITQIPKYTGLGIGENLIAGDRPIIEFRKRRDKLKKENNKQDNN
jgi:phenylpropionate dioxygenase-like ring-hydroxylating dioxygenase large terminal subunit